MTPPDETRAEALKRLSSSAKALEGRAVKTPPDYGGHQAASYGYRLMGVLIGGLFIGLGFGAIVDYLAGTGPWGMIVGVLVGFAVSIWMAVRSAKSIAEQTEKEWGPAKDLPFDDDEDV